MCHRGLQWVVVCGDEPEMISWGSDGVSMERWSVTDGADGLGVEVYEGRDWLMRKVDDDGDEWEVLCCSMEAVQVLESVGGAGMAATRGSGQAWRAAAVGDCWQSRVAGASPLWLVVA
ncbi:hypothetical protein V6N11_071278 [Hibiscus sabdariffa]|uniref:Uncharacterized protein n=1 Tax=Hibiscus sabdariffa TaxID=183260 RepID=A0ABR2TZQ7_9ROSI